MGRGGGASSASWGSEDDPTSAHVPGASGTADLGPLCPTNFNVSVGASGVCKEITRFVAPAYVGELFWSMPLLRMLWSIEANAAKVGLKLLFPYHPFFSTTCLVQTLMLSCMLKEDITCCYAKIQG